MSFYTKAFLTSVIYLFAFLALFVLFQNNTFYSKTLGRVSQNYEHVGDFGVQKVSKPYTRIKNENFERWDACIYQCIKDRDYIDEEGYYGHVRGAFFPLFPYTWKLLHLNNIGISLLNYFLFALAVMLLVNNFFNVIDSVKLLTFLLFISLPSTIVFSIPYTEAFFIITATLMFIGITKNNYRLYFIAALLLAMVRPATLFVFLSIFSIEVIILFLKKRPGDFLKGITSKLLPFIGGYILSIFIQFLSSGSFTTYFKAQSHWEGKLGLIKEFSDWSVEGFGLSAFTIFFVALPVLFYTTWLVLGNRRIFKDLENRFNFTEVIPAKNYVLLINLFYICGLTVFTSLVTLGNLHGFFRFILCTPAFYIVLIFLLNSINEIQPKTRHLVFAASFIFYLIFLFSTDYNGGIRADFSFFGSYLFVANMAFVVFFNNKPFSFKLILLSCILLLNLVWNTYLFNCFLSDAWIFT